MSSSPSIYGICPAGCKYETVHKADFDAVETDTNNIKDGTTPVSIKKHDDTMAGIVEDANGRLTFGSVIIPQSKTIKNTSVSVSGTSTSITLDENIAVGDNIEFYIDYNTICKLKVMGISDTKLGYIGWINVYPNGSCCYSAEAKVLNANTITIAQPYGYKVNGTTFTATFDISKIVKVIE